MKYLRPLLLYATLLICMGGLGVATSQIKSHRAQLPPALVSRQAVLASTKFMKVVSGEFKGVLADFLLLKGMIIDGGQPEKMTPQDWDAVYALYKQSLELDPYFYQTAFYIQGNLFWTKGMVEKAVELLKISADHRPWDWAPLWYIGFDYAYFLNDKTLAASYFYKASKLPGAPESFVIIAARLAKAGGDTLTSIAMLKTMLDQTDDEKVRKILEDRITAHLGVLQIENAIQNFRKNYGRLPKSLEELIDTGILNKLPDNAYSDSYKYDAKTGEVDYGKK